jgi:hypothetical protein
MPAACAALSTLVPGGALVVRVAVGSRESVRIVSDVVTGFDCSMLPPMTTTPLDTLRRIAALAGYSWTDAELEALRPAVERALESLERLEDVPLGDVEPTTHYRVL